MFDSNLRAFKDRVFDPISRLVPNAVSPLHITGVAFVCGILCCATAAYDRPLESEILWGLNRALDCLDGAVARQRNQASDLGGFLDLLGDFIVYSLIPICCGLSNEAHRDNSDSPWISIAVVEASFHINNFILFYVAAVVEKQKAFVKEAMSDKKSAASKQGRTLQNKTELTSVAMRPTLIEGTESAILFTMMLAKPAWLEQICWWMAALVCIGVFDRTRYVVIAMKN